jgi:hypothetical protein
MYNRTCPQCNVTIQYKNKIKRDKGNTNNTLCSKCCCKVSDLKRRGSVQRKVAVRKYKLRFKYGITIDEYNKMLKKQNNVCLICKRPETEHNKNLAVDHNHNTGKVRGLLCCKCNKGLGHFEDNALWLRIAADYLDNSKQS